MDASAIAGAISSVTGLLDIAKGIRAADQRMAITDAVAGIHVQLIEALERERALLAKVNDLEQAQREGTEFDRERERYKFQAISPGVFAYVLKPATELAAQGFETQEEPIHCLCPKCFGARRKSIIQVTRWDMYGSVTLQCPECGTELKAWDNRGGFPLPQIRNT